MAWIESHQALANHPKMKRLCRLLGVGRAPAVGHLHLLWWWALDYAPDGDLSAFEAEVIAEAAEWEGDPQAFVEALDVAGFVHENALHDWDDYGGKYHKRREQSRERQQRFRDSRGRYKRPSNDEVTRYSSVSNASVRGSNTVRGQDIERRGEDTTHTLGENGATEPPSEPEQPAGKPAARVRYTAEFEEFWTLYPKGHGDKKPAFESWKRLTPEDRAAAVAGLDKWLTSDRWERGIILDAQRYLSRRRWESDPPPPRIETLRTPDEAMSAWLKVVAEVEYHAEHGEWRQGIKLAPAAVEAAKAIGGRNNIDPANEFQRRDFLAAYRAAAAAPEEATP